MKQLAILLVGILTFTSAFAEENSDGDATDAAIDAQVESIVGSATVTADAAKASEMAGATAGVATAAALGGMANKTDKDAKLKVDESKIPVFNKQKEKGEASSSPYTRLILSCIVLAGMAAGLIFFSRWFSKRTGGQEKKQSIQMLSQMHLGPRKSLAVVRVSGETLLIGITDQNIRLIKGLSLLDEEVEQTTSSFQDTLQRETRDISDMDLKSIRDQITRKTNNMRPFA